MLERTPLVAWSWARALARVVLAAVLAACGGGGGNPQQPSAPALQLDAAKAITKTLGYAGGSLSTTATDGTRYTVIVPAGALRGELAITLTPIAAIGDLPAGAKLAGGAHLAPEGQSFDAPVTLTITPAVAPTAAPVPFAYSGELQQRRLYPATVAAGAITFEIVHFSGYAALLEQLAGVVDDYIPPPGSRGDQALGALVSQSLQPASPARTASMVAALRGWLDDAILPAVVGVQTLSSIDLDPNSSSTALSRAVGLRAEFQIFSVALTYAVLSGVSRSELGAIEDDERIAVRDAARHLIPLYNAACSQFSAAWVFAVPEVFTWQTLAQGTGAAAIEPALDRAAVLQALCVQVAYDPNGGVDFPTGIVAGQSGTLSVRAGYTVNGGPLRFDEAMLVSALGTGASSDLLTGGSTPVAAGATYTRQFLWEPTASEMRIDVEACLEDPAWREICQRAFVVRGAPLALCPSYEVEVRGQTSSSRDYGAFANAGFSEPGAYGAASLGGDLSLNLSSAYAGTSTARGALAYRVDASRATGDTFDVLWQWQGSSDIHLGGSCSATVTVGGVSRSFTTATSATGSRFATYDFTFPMNVRHGDLVPVRLEASCTSPGMLVASSVSMRVTAPSGDLQFNAVTCAP